MRITSFWVASGKADKDRVTLGGAGGFHGGKAGVAQSFTVYVRDAYDNPENCSVWNAT